MSGEFSGAGAAIFQAAKDRALLALGRTMLFAVQGRHSLACEEAAIAVAVGQILKDSRVPAVRDFAEDLSKAGEAIVDLLDQLEEEDKDYDEDI